MSLLTNEEIHLLNSDNKYRNYVSSIEKALKNFESSTEWADLISSLNKLKKVLTSSPKYQFIPKRVSVCKRLAQCLHPALPSGVHLKALEVYNLLFENIGPDNLSKDLFIYSSGLFPLLANAALSVKPVLIQIYETHFLKLKKGLRPCLTGLILGILPGLEEGSDYYNRTFTLLKNICDAQSETSSSSSNQDNGLDEKYFYTCLWSAIVAQSSIRFPAIQFILANYESKKKAAVVASKQQQQQNSNKPEQEQEDQLYLIGNSIELMINGICCCLQDSNSLVQRTILDFIGACLPMHTVQITKNDKLQLIVVAIHVVLRRDMSLNRRIYSWFMGSDSTTVNKSAKSSSNNNNNNKTTSDDYEELKKQKKNDYFDLHSKMLLISSIKMLLNNKKEPNILYLFNEDQSVTFTTALPSSSQAAASSSNTLQNNHINLNNSTSLFSNTSSTLRILKIVSNLVERQDIGQSIIDEILLDLLFYVYKEYFTLNNNNNGNSSNYTNLTVSGSAAAVAASSNQINSHRRTNSTIIVSNNMSGGGSTTTSSKELNELKKACYNFLFESFQRYFIWEFCANKFELICKNYSEASSTITPGQLCDLYEFILDLLKTNEMYAEIHSEYLPLMLKRIIKTLNKYCSKLNNLDLSKSILLCSKILKKVIPENLIDNNKHQQRNHHHHHHRNQQHKRTISSDKQQQQSKPKTSSNSDQLQQVIESEKSISSTTTTTNIKKINLEEDESSVINDLLNDLISQIETAESLDDNPNKIEEELAAVEVLVVETQPKNEKNYFIIESCVFYLKQLFHTFIRSHLIQTQADTTSHSFMSLFDFEDYSSFYSTNYNKNDLNCTKCNNNKEQQELNNINDTNNNNNNLIYLKPDSLNYLHSFQILNKFLFKMFVHPREKDQDDVDETNAKMTNALKSVTKLEDEQDEQHQQQNECCKKARKNKINKLIIESMDEWLKDLFIISCCSTLTTNNNNNNNNNSSKQLNSFKLFEFQSITINTIIELINLSESVNAHFSTNSNNGSNIATTSNSRKNSMDIIFNLNEMKTALPQQQQQHRSTCFVQTVFTKKQIDLIYNHSTFGTKVAKMLWSHLSNESFVHSNTISSTSNSNNNNSMITNSSANFSNNNNNQFLALQNKSESATDKRASILFCLLHETLPNNLCEDIITQHLIKTDNNNNSNKEDGNYLSSRMDSLKRFMRLWHWSREINASPLGSHHQLGKITTTNNNNNMDDNDDLTEFINDFISLKTNLTFKNTTKTFERSLLIILDMLSDKQTPCTIIKLIQDWLTTLILDYNDLPRLLDILLVSLLHPSTARVSSQFYINNLIKNSFSASLITTNTTNKTDNNHNIEPEIDYESKVYAISNEGGNVKYHVNNETVAAAGGGAGITVGSVPLNNKNNNKSFMLTSLNTSDINNQSYSSLPSLTNSSLNTSSNNTSGGSGSGSGSAKHHLAKNIELPLSILNAAALASQGNSLSLRINPLKADSNGTITDETDYVDSLMENQENNLKNANFLEKYKALKSVQLKPPAASNPNSIASSPSHHLVKINKSIDDLNDDYASINNDNNDQIDQFETNDYFNNSGEEEEDEEDDDEEEEEEEENDDNNNDDDDDEEDETSEYQSGFHNTENENYYDISSSDTQSQSTDITTINENQLGAKKLKRKSDLIETNNKTELSQKKSLSLTGRYKSKQSSNNKSKENSPKSKLILNTLNNSQITLKEKSATIGSRHPMAQKTSHHHISPCRALLTKKISPISNTKQINNSASTCNLKELLIDACNPVDPNYSYLLIYTNCNNMQASLNNNNTSTTTSSNKLLVRSAASSPYDHTRIMFILRCLDQLLNKCPKEFLTSVTRTLVTTNTNLNQTYNKSNQTGFSVHNEKLLDLIVRHLKSMYGQSFYSDGVAATTNSFDLNKINFNLNNVTYIEAITLVLLFYIRSYYPPSEFSLINEKFEINSNLTKLTVEDSTTISTSSNTSLNTTTSSCVSHHSSSASNDSTSLAASKSANTSTLSQSSPHLPISTTHTDHYELLLANKSKADTDEKLYIENRNVQIYCLQILSKMIKELSNLCKFTNNTTNNNSNSSGFFPSTYNQTAYQPIIDLLDKCKLQKTLLHCFYSTTFIPVSNTLAHCILSNSKYANKDSMIKDEFLYARKQTQHAYMSELMDALENLIQLEKLLLDFQTISKINRGLNNGIRNGLVLNSSSNANSNSSNSDQNEEDFLITLNNNNNNKKSTTTNTGVQQTNLNNNTNNTSNSTRYISIQSICNQSLFVSSILHYLKQMNLIDFHLPILKLVKNSLPSAGNNLRSLSNYVIVELCKNLLQITNCNVSGSSSSSSTSYLIPSIAYMSSLSASINIPDLIVSILKQLSYLLHYCLLSTTNILGSNDLNLNSLMMSTIQNPNLSEAQSKTFKSLLADNETCLNQAKDLILNNLLSGIISSMTQVWQRCNLLLNSNGVNGVNILFESISQQNQQQYNQHQYSWILGHPTVIKQTITEMLSPIVQYHGASFMTAIGIVWGEKRKRSKLNQEHKVIIEIIKSLKICTIPVILTNIIDIIKLASSNSNKDKKKTNLNIVWLLQFLHAYLESYSQSVKKRTPDTADSLKETINSLCNFFKEFLSSSSTTSNLVPACFFQLFRILHDSVNNFPELVDSPDKKYSKDIQDSTHKLFEICNSIVASSLQQTTWLRKNFAVKLVPTTTTSTANNTNTFTAHEQQKPLYTNSSIPSNLYNLQNGQLHASQTLSNLSSNPINNSNNLSIANPSIAGSDITSHKSINSSVDTNSSSGYGGSNSMINHNSNMSNINRPIKSETQITSLSDLENEIGSNISDATSNLNSIDQNNGDLNDANNLNQSLQALNILAEYLAKTLDIVYKSEEKERLVVPLLTSLMFNLWPYLKTHSIANKNNFRAATHLLMTLTIHPYTRKTWKKEVFEMLFDNLYFYVDSQTLEDFKIIIDSLMTSPNDRTIFKDVLVRVQYQQSSGLFTSKEQESEQKAQLLKRLAFVIYSSEKDQYQKNMPEIQECIAHILKLVQSPNLYSTLFLLFRILLLRISSRHLIALWPTMLTETIIILLQMEQDLTEETDFKNSTKTSFLDHIANTNTSMLQSNSTKLQIYLSVCKLIDLVLTLPSSVTAQFQLCKWSFINTVETVDSKQSDQFVPYLVKINNLLKLKFPDVKTMGFKITGGPLIRQRQILSLVELKPFFELVNRADFFQNSNQAYINQQNNLQLNNNYLKQFEMSVHEDFLENWLQ